MNEIHSRPVPPSPAVEPQASGRAIASLVFAILGIAGVAPCIGSILGIVLGHGEASGVGRAGAILGWVTLGLQVLLVCLVLVALGAGFLFRYAG